MTDSDFDSVEPVVKQKESFWKRNLSRLSSSRSSARQLLTQSDAQEINSELTENPSEDNLDIIRDPQQQKNQIRRPRSAGDISEVLHQCSHLDLVTGISSFPGGSADGGNHSSSISTRTSPSNTSSSSSNSRQNNTSESQSGQQNNNNNYNNNESSSSSSNNSGGILSFFGVKFKSGTRHLDRSSGCNSEGGGLVSGKCGSGTSSAAHPSANNNNRLVADLRYTKFPLAYGKNALSASSNNSSTVAAAGGQSNNNRLNDVPTSSTITSSSSSSGLISLHRHKSKLSGRSLDSSQVDAAGAEGSSSGFSVNAGIVVSSIPSDSPFEESHIHFTPQTKTYAHPHRSPIPPSRSNSSHGTSSGNFITNTVSSIGRKVVNSVTPGSKGKHNKSKLKVKSKSDNNLHRVNSNVNVNSVLAGSSNSSGSVVPRNASTSAFTSYLDNHHQGSHSVESGGAERRLNSVQLGDHATIRLPWTGFQQINNLSSVSSSRPFIPNTHNNNLEFSTSGGERYVECGSSSILRSVAPLPTSSSATSGPTRTVSGASNSGGGSSGSSRIIVTRRRSRSLERCSNFRVIPISSSSGGANAPLQPSSNQSLFWRELDSRSAGAISRSQSRKETGSERETQRTRSAHSLERNTSHRVRQQLTTTEQEILLRNIDWNSPPIQQQPPRRPDKPSKPGIFPSAGFPTAGRTLSRKELPQQNHHHRPFEKLHRSAPNSSFSNSSESGESSYSAPPSPPPRPASTLKPESRLIIQHPNTNHHHHTSSGVPLRHHHLITSPTSSCQGSFPHSISATSGVGVIMNPIPKRRPIPPRSHGSSSDSGVSHISSTSTVRGTSDFSDESGGSVNISQHSQHSTSVVSHSTTSSSGVSHHSSSANSNAVSATAAGISLEDVRNSGFINKPTKGWLHSDQMLSKEGVTYTVRYIGCLDVNTSMKSLDFDTRSLIAKECINQVCEAAGLRSGDKKRKMDRRVARILGIRPRLDHAGSDVRLTITSTCLKLTSLETGAVIAVHDMPNISFASGGDATMLDFVAYVAKDTIVGRACFVLECGSGLSQDVITTVGQAFELRFKEYLQKRPPPPRIPMDDPEYYNDLPGKFPPDIQAGNSAESKDKIQNVPKNKNAMSRAKEPPPLNLHSTSDKELSVNLIDFEAPTPPAFGPSVEDKLSDSFLLPGSENTNGANSLGASVGNASSVMGTGLGLPNSPSQPQPKDPFDMQPFAAALPQSIPASVIEDQRRLLEGEIWFHGTVSRGEAEELMKHDGDFLVRESMACPGQFVLTGVQGGSSKHLLLVDPEGVVRTKDRTFDNVIHLIKYHSENSLPIISAESMVLLRSPVPRVISS